MRLRLKALAWTTSTGRQYPGLGEDLSPLKLAYLYQESFSTDLSWARSNAGSTVAGLREYT